MAPAHEWIGRQGCVAAARGRAIIEPRLAGVTQWQSGCFPSSRSWVRIPSPAPGSWYQMSPRPAEERGTDRLSGPGAFSPSCPVLSRGRPLQATLLSALAASPGCPGPLCRRPIAISCPVLLSLAHARSLWGRFPPVSPGPSPRVPASPVLCRGPCTRSCPCSPSHRRPVRTVSGDACHVGYTVATRPSRPLTPGPRGPNPLCRGGGLPGRVPVAGGETAGHSAHSGGR